MIAMFGNVRKVGRLATFTARDGEHRKVAYIFHGHGEWDGELVLEAVDAQIEKFHLSAGWAGTITANPRVIETQRGMFIQVFDLVSATEVRDACGRSHGDGVMYIE